MKVKSKSIKGIVALMILLNTMMITAGAFTFEEENLDDELINIEDREINDVDMNNVIIGNMRVSARNAIAIDSKTKQVLYEQNSYEIVPMASTTKILTALVAISTTDLDKEIVVSKNAAGIRGSTVGYRAGDKLKLRELLFGLMFKSGNDAAIAIAEGIGGSVENYANLMNDYAKSLGLVCSHFESPHGLDSAKHYTTAYDLALLTAKAMENEFFREICGEKTISKDKYNFTRDYQNINKILWKIPNANGVKTGYTGQAGKCLVSSVRHNDRNIIIVVFNCVDRWNVTEKIFKYVESNYAFKGENNINLLESKQINNLGSLIEESDFEYGFKEDNSIDIEVFKPVTDIEKGDVIGKISLIRSSDELIKQPITVNKNISKETFERLVFLNGDAS